MAEVAPEKVINYAPYLPLTSQNATPINSSIHYGAPPDFENHASTYHHALSPGFSPILEYGYVPIIYQLWSNLHQKTFYINTQTLAYYISIDLYFEPTEEH